MSKKTNLLLILINLGCLTLFLEAWLSYNHRQNIIEFEKPLNNYSVLEIDAHSPRMSSSIKINYNNKVYYVGLTSKQCKSFNPQNVKLYYDKDGDAVFEQNELNERIIVFYFILYLCSCIWLLYVIGRFRYLK